MANPKEVIDTIKRTKIVAIIRGIDKGHILKTVEALFKGGIKALEITLNRDDAMESIEIVKKEFEEEILLGAGTVLKAGMKEAYERGACFYCFAEYGRSRHKANERLRHDINTGCLFTI